MKKVDANCFIDVLCNCPYCGSLEDVFEKVREDMDVDHRADNCDVQVTCSECKSGYIIENVTF